MRKIKKSKRSPIPGILAKNKTLAIQNLVQSKTLKASDFDSSRTNMKNALIAKKR